MKAKKGKEKQKEKTKDTVKDGKTGAQEKDGQDGGKEKDMQKTYTRYMTISMKTVDQKEKMRTMKTRTKKAG